MKFLLSDDQATLVAAVRDFAVKRCDAGVRREAFESATGHDPDFWRGLVGLGVAGIAVSEQDGGLGLGLLELALAGEVLGYAGAPGPFFGHVMAIQSIVLCGSEGQKRNWLPRLLAGDTIGTIAWSEPGISMPERWSASLSASRLSGRKVDVPYAAQADLMVVGTEDGFALVEGNALGIGITEHETNDRTRRLSTVEFSATPAAPMPASGELRRRTFDAALVLLAADAFGGACRLMDMSVDYAKVREQFGRPIGSFMGLKHQLADMAVDVEPARGLYWYAAHAHDENGEDHSRVAAIAKAHLAEIYMKTARTAIETHGGIGYTWEYDAQIWYKRAMHDFAMLGTPAIHRERAVSLAGWEAARRL